MKSILLNLVPGGKYCIVSNNYGNARCFNVKKSALILTIIFLLCCISCSFAEKTVNLSIDTTSSSQEIDRSIKITSNDPEIYIDVKKQEDKKNG